MYKQREILLVPFPFSDLSSSKRRPVLVVSNDVYNQHFPDILVCVITSNLFGDEYSVPLSEIDLETGLLPESSLIKCHKLFTIQQSLILRRFSIVSPQKFLEVYTMLESLIEPKELAANGS
ncbi:MAG: type II toxin-antitoxin system PemK/MazF family toxin [Flavisolibacter sp.]|nr:type II toxin-antitoxin system PemK/MazF family toxin [Flavisolibacter sp.]